jgi:hypothetical protein
VSRVGDPQTPTTDLNSQKRHWHLMLTSVTSDYKNGDLVIDYVNEILPVTSPNRELSVSRK